MNNEYLTNTSRSSSMIYLLLFVIPIFTVLLYGGTDVSALIPLALSTGTLSLIWIFRTWKSSLFEFSTDSQQIPLLALLLLGAFQLLPLGGPAMEAGTLAVPVSHSLSIDPFWTRIFLVRLAGYIIFFAAALTFIDSESRYRKAISTILIFGGVIAFIGILQKLASPEAIYGLRKHSGAIPFGPYINSHHFASLMVLISGLAIAHLLGKAFTRQTKLLIGIAAAIMAIAVPFTGSRGGVIAYVSMIAFASLASLYGVSEKGGRRVVPLVAGGVSLLVIVIGSLLYLGGEGSMLRGFGLDNSAEDISSGRFHFWGIAWKIFLANPVIGTGLDTFGVAFTSFDTWSGAFRVEQAHNDYLQILADGGIIGFAIVGSFIVLLFIKGLRRIKNETNDMIRTTVVGCLAGCVGIFVHSFFDFPLRTAGNAYFFLLIVALMLAPVTSTMFATTERGRSRPSSRMEP